MEVLPGDGFYPGWNGRTLSADGNVVIGHYASARDSYYFRWTPGGVTTRLPTGPGGYTWYYPTSLTKDGNTIVGYGRHINYASLSWTSGIGTRTVTDGTPSVYIGVTPDASYSVRVDLGLKKQTAYRDYRDLTASKWATVNSESGEFDGVSGDASRLFGRAQDTYFEEVLPCYWNSAGDIVFCAALADQHDPYPLFANKSGQFIAGTVNSGQYIEGYGDGTTTFVWDTATNQVVYYAPLIFLFNYPVFLSPDGKILGIGGYITPTDFHTYILDQSTPSQASLGYQDIGDWLVSQQYLSRSDLEGKTEIVVSGMSDDKRAVVGTYEQNSRLHAFYARRPIYTTYPIPEIRE